MSKNTMFYGLLIAGGLLAYYAWKKHNASGEEISESSTSTTPLSHTSGVFVDDVPVSPKVLGLNTTPETVLDNVKNTVSNIVEPFIGTKQQTQLTNQGQFLES